MHVSACVCVSVCDGSVQLPSYQYHTIDTTHTERERHTHCVLNDTPDLVLYIDQQCHCLYTYVPLAEYILTVTLMGYVVAGYGQYQWHLWNPVGDAAMVATLSPISCVCV